MKTKITLVVKDLKDYERRVLTEYISDQLVFLGRELMSQGYEILDEPAKGKKKEVDLSVG